MADTWLTIEQAAVALGLSVRTVNRHIVAGKIQSRLNDGRREVLVDMPEEQAAAEPAEDGAAASADSPFAAERLTIDSQGADYARQASDYARQTSDHVRQASQRPDHAPVVDPNTVLALADNAAEKAELAISAYQALARSTDMQFQSVRRSARLAWGSVAVMAAGVAVAVGWTSHYLTKAQLQGQFLRQQVETTANAADKASAERDSLRTELSAAREQAARAEGQVAVLTDAKSAAGAPVATAGATAEPEPEPVSDRSDDASVAAGAMESESDAPATTRPVNRASILERISSLLNERSQ